MKKIKKSTVFIPVMLAATFFIARVETGQAPTSPPPIKIRSLKHDLSHRLRDLGPISPSKGSTMREIPIRRRIKEIGVGPTAAVSKGQSSDMVAQSIPGGFAMPAPFRNFEGLNNLSGVFPPDTNGDVGPSHYIQWVNLSFAIYDKSGTLLFGPAAGDTLWNGFGGPCETTNDGDPIVLYDHLADRWLMSQFANISAGPPYHQCIAISQTGDPTGAWYRYDFLYSNTKANDYPKFGLWPDAYYMTANQFVGNSWAGAGVMAFEREQMLAGLPADMVYFDLFNVNPNLGGMLPSHLDGPPPPNGTPNYFVEVDDTIFGFPTDSLRIWEFHVDWANPSNSTFGISGLPNTVLDTALFDSNMCNFSSNCIPQPNTTAKLDALSDRLMYRLQYRNFGSYQTLVTNHTVDVDGTNHAGIRWYELRNSGSGWSIEQQGTYAPDSNHRWMGSIAMDGSGNIALGFSVSGSNIFPSIRYVGRLNGDTPGAMTQAETTLFAGGGSQTNAFSRWGDYSVMAVDPIDNCTFWYTQEYYATTSSGGWHTRIGSFKFPTCGIDPVTAADLSITMNDSPDPVVAGNPLTYTLMVTNNGPATATGVTVTDTLPAGVTFGSAASSPGSCTGTSTVTCTLGTLGTGGTATVTIIVTPTVAGVPTNTASVTGNQADLNPSNNTATATTTVTAGITADLALTKTGSTKVKVGKTLTYTIGVTNKGPATATGVTVTDTLPAGATFGSGTPSQGSCSGTNTVTCPLGTLAKGARATVRIVVTLTARGKLTNTASVGGNETDLKSSNNTATLVTTVQ